MFLIFFNCTPESLKYSKTLQPKDRDKYIADRIQYINLDQVNIIETNQHLVDGKMITIVTIQTGGVKTRGVVRGTISTPALNNQLHRQELQ